MVGENEQAYLDTLIHEFLHHLERVIAFLVIKPHPPDRDQRATVVQPPPLRGLWVGIRLLICGLPPLHGWSIVAR